MTPKQVDAKTYTYLSTKGLTEKVEKKQRLRGKTLTFDLLGFVDFITFTPTGLLLTQTTTTRNTGARVRKILNHKKFYALQQQRTDYITLQVIAWDSQFSVKPEIVTILPSSKANWQLFAPEIAKAHRVASKRKTK